MVLTGVATVSQPGFAQETQTPLEQIVITAARGPERLEDIPASVTILDHDQIQKADARTMDQTLTKEVGDIDADSPGVSQTPDAPADPSRDIGPAQDAPAHGWGAHLGRSGRLCRLGFSR